MGCREDLIQSKNRKEGSPSFHVYLTCGACCEVAEWCAVARRLRQVLQPLVSSRSLRSCWPAPFPLLAWLPGPRLRPCHRRAGRCQTTRLPDSAELRENRQI